MNSLKVEYISIHKIDVPLCRDAETVVRAIQADGRFKRKDGKLIYESTTYNYRATDWKSNEHGICILHEFEIERDNDSIIERQCAIFSQMLRAFKENLHVLGMQRIDTLWNDISFHYCKISYPRILHTENVMRKLITQFMLQNLGSRWVDMSAPKEVRDELSRSKRKLGEADPLHNLDFISLADYLLKPYSTATVDELYKSIKEISMDKGDKFGEEIEALKQRVPLTNWSRYFSSIVQCEDTKLQKQWHSLYELRCKVAHNTYVSETEYGEIDRLCADLDSVLEQAISRLGRVTVPTKNVAELERFANDVAEASSGSPSGSAGGGSTWDMDATHGVLRRELRKLEMVLRQLARESNLQTEQCDLTNLCRTLLAQGLIPVNLKRAIDNAEEVLDGAGGQLHYPTSAIRRCVGEIKSVLLELVPAEPEATESVAPE